MHGIQAVTALSTDDDDDDDDDDDNDGGDYSVSFYCTGYLLLLR